MAQKSSKFGEIITKTVAVEENEPNQTSSKRLPPPRQVKWRVFLAGFLRGDPKAAKIMRRCKSPFWIATFRGEGEVICGLI
jgi:hypothetical protein